MENKKMYILSFCILIIIGLVVGLTFGSKDAKKEKEKKEKKNSLTCIGTLREKVANGIEEKRVYTFDQTGQAKSLEITLSEDFTNTYDTISEDVIESLPHERENHFCGDQNYMKCSSSWTDNKILISTYQYDFEISGSLGTKEEITDSLVNSVSRYNWSCQ